MSAAENVTRELASLLAQLRAADPGFRVFGSAKHRYEVRRTRWAWELVAIEAAHRFVIPDDYRAFLLRVGDGGAGPDYGLVPLGDAVAEVGTGAFRPESLQDDDSAWDGRIEIGDHGCAIYSSLVVRGAMYGSVWCGRESLEQTHPSFADWYRAWAERKLRRLDATKYIAALRIGMTTRDVEQATDSRWTAREVGARTLLEEATGTIPAQLELDPTGRVVKVLPAKFL